MPAHFASKMEKPSSLQETRQWKSRIASEEKVAYGGRRNKKREKRAEVARFVDDLRNKLLEIVHLKGGTEFSILRHTFLDWDKVRQEGRGTRLG